MIEFFTENFNTIGDYLLAASAVIASASAITLLTPTKTDDKILNYILAGLNFLALNIFKNKNAE